MASKYDALERYRGQSGVSVTVPDGDNGIGAMLAVALFAGLLVLALLFVPPFGIVLGVVAIAFAFRERTEREWVQDAPVEDVESLSLGPSAVLGTVTPAESEPLPAPFTDEPCVSREWEIEEDRSRNDRRIAAGTDAVPFYVDDGTGKVLVRPDEDRTRILHGSGDFENDAPDLAYRLGVRDPITEVVSVAPGSAVPDRIATFLDERGLDGGSFQRDYRQRLVRPGEDVYVFGLVQRREDGTSAANEENLVFQPAPSNREDQEPAFVVSTIPRAKLVARQWWFWILAGIGGALVLANVLVLGIVGLFLLPVLA